MGERYRPLSGREQPRFAAIKTFFRLPYAASLDEPFEVGLCGVPFDGGVSYRPGARFAPTRVREISSLGRVYHMGRMVNWADALEVADIGDCPTVPISQAETYQKIEDFHAAAFGAGKKVITVGGDHSITLPILRAAARRFGKLNLIHFDAHLDTYPAAWGQEYHHGAFLRHVVSEGLVARVLQLGIRGPLAGGDDLDFVRAHNVDVRTVDDLRDAGLAHFLATLPTFDDGPTYITYDVDCLDPAFAPGTGTPVPGGLTTYETQRILRALSISNLVGADVVEVSPPFDHADITALAAMDALFEFLTIMAAGKG